MPINSHIKNEILNLWINLKNGIRLAFFQKDTLFRFVINTDQVILLVLFNILLFVCVDYLKYLPDPYFNFYALAGFSQQLLGLLFAAFVLAKLAGNSTVILSFIIQVLTLTAFFYAIWNFISEINLPPYDYYVYILWILAVVGFIVFHHVDKNIKKSLATIGAYGLFVVAPAM